MIASITAKELVIKDFSMEADESKMLHAAICMSQCLAGNISFYSISYILLGSLASVTSKDPLRAAIINNLRNSLAPNSKPVPTALENAIHTIVQDNLDLACAVVQKAASEACYKPTEEHLHHSIQHRKQFKDRTGRKGQVRKLLNQVNCSSTMM